VARVFLLGPPSLCSCFFFPLLLLVFSGVPSKGVICGAASLFSFVYLRCPAGRHGSSRTVRSGNKNGGAVPVVSRESVIYKWRYHGLRRQSHLVVWYRRNNSIISWKHMAGVNRLIKASKELAQQFRCCTCQSLRTITGDKKLYIDILSFI